MCHAWLTDLTLTHMIHGQDVTVLEMCVAAVVAGGGETRETHALEAVVSAMRHWSDSADVPDVCGAVLDRDLPGLGSHVLGRVCECTKVGPAYNMDY